MKVWKQEKRERNDCTEMLSRIRLGERWVLYDTGFQRAPQAHLLKDENRNAPWRMTCGMKDIRSLFYEAVILGDGQIGVRRPPASWNEVMEDWLVCPFCLGWPRWDGRT